MFNTYADHFLEDAFSSGHLLVNRTIGKSIINNKSQHDFYCKHGTMVTNSKGEIWTAYGDNYLNKNGNSNLLSNLNSLKYEDLNADDKRIIEAVEYSITEIQFAFENESKFNNLSATDFITNFKALQLVPLPYNTNLKKIFPTAISDSVKKANSKPYLRNFIRNRSANSITLGVTNGRISKSYFEGIELRLNAGLLHSAFKYKAGRTKKGTADIWAGYTMSYTTGTLTRNDIGNNAKLFKFGTRTNLDLWISNKSFIGLFMYNEVGVIKNLQKYKPIFSPQLGLQLGSLFKINYYNMRAIKRIPLQLILPLKFKVNSTYVPNYKPIYSQSVELDLTF